MGWERHINTKPVSSNLKSDNSQNKLDLDSKYKFGENISSNLINQNAINFLQAKVRRVNNIFLCAEIFLFFLLMLKQAFN